MERPGINIRLEPPMLPIDVMEALQRACSPLMAASPELAANMNREGALSLEGGRSVRICARGADDGLLVTPVPGTFDSRGLREVRLSWIGRGRPPCPQELASPVVVWACSTLHNDEELSGAVKRALRAQTGTVYGIMHPRIRETVNALFAGFRFDLVTDMTFAGGQDQIQRPFLERARGWYLRGGVEVSKQAFPFAFFTAGASEALEKLLCHPYKRLHVFDGEYEGAGHIARSMGLEVATHERDGFLDDPAFDPALGSSLPGAFWPKGSGRREAFYVSAPSAIDGEYWGGFERFIRQMALSHPQVDIIVDVTYVGLVKKTEPLRVALDRNVKAVVFSLSKPFGVYHYRIGGVFLREAPGEHSRFGGADWFKNVPMIILGDRLLLSSSGPLELPGLWASAQAEAVALHKLHGLLPEDAVPANAVLLARSRSSPPRSESAAGPSVSVRAGAFRYCLSPTMHRLVEAECRATARSDER